MGDAFTQYKMGLNHAPAYTVSGIPYVTGTIPLPSNTGNAVEIKFPFITQQIKIHNHSTSEALRVAFSANGIKNGNYWIVDEEAASGKGQPYMEMRVKTDKIYLLSNTTNACSGAIIFAEMTGIPSHEYPLATAYSGAAGIG